jgi:DNA-binding transcriptional MocR family regulator
MVESTAQDHGGQRVTVVMRDFCIGVAVNPLAAFYAANVTESGLVLGYGAIPLHQIEDGLQLLRHLLNCS